MGNGDVIAQLLVEKKPFSLFDFLRTSQYVFVGSFFVVRHKKFSIYIHI